MQTSVVSIVSDGAPIMKKLCNISQLITNSATRMMCIWLCVMYCTKNISVTHIAGKNYDYDDDQDEKMCDEGFGIVIPAAASKKVPVPVFNVEIENVPKKVPKVVKTFRRSPVKNEVLQKYVLLEQNKELSLVLDCKTRWSSMYKMIERFIYLKKCISKALLDLSIEHDISTTEFLFLNELKCVFEPIKLVVEALYRKNATLLTAEGIFQFLFCELKKKEVMPC